MTPPRLFGIPARNAPVVAVLRRGPSDWCHIGRWDVGAQPAYQPGAWLRGTIYPQRCDLSPDGRWLAYFVLTGRPAADWRAGGTYVAVSRLPWASALAAWGTDGTWTHGVRFDDDRSVWDVGEPDEGDAAPCRARYGLGWVRSVTYAVERRTGWTETPDSPAYDERDPWEIQRAPRLTMARQRPGGGATLQVTCAYAAFCSFDTRHYGEPVYRLTDGVTAALPTGCSPGCSGPTGRRTVGCWSPRRTGVCRSDRATATTSCGSRTSPRWLPTRSHRLLRRRSGRAPGSHQLEQGRLAAGEVGERATRCPPCLSCAHGPLPTTSAATAPAACSERRAGLGRAEPGHLADQGGASTPGRVRPRG